MSCLYQQVACCGDGDGGGSADDTDIVAATVPELLRAVGEDPSRPGLIETPKVSELVRAESSILAGNPAARGVAVSSESVCVLTQASSATANG